MAKDYRLFVEFDWDLPIKASAEDLVREMLFFLASPSLRRARRAGDGHAITEEGRA
jgi:hypothetical protein